MVALPAERVGDRLSNVLFVVDDGRLTEQGTHQELLAIPDGTYRKLHDMQIELQEAV